MRGALNRMYIFNEKWGMPLAKSIFSTKNEGCPYQNLYCQHKMRDALSKIDIFNRK